MMKSADLANVLSRLLPRIWRFTLRLVGDASLAEDLVRRSCWTALDHEDEMPADKDVSLWLFAILHDVWQRDFRIGDTRNPATRPASARTQAKRTLSYRQMIIEAVIGLPDVQRFAMLLVTVEGISIRDASEVLGRPVEATEKLILQARLTVGSSFYGCLNETDLGATE